METKPAGSLLITGASGYVASALIPRLRDRGYEVHALDKTPPDERIGKLCASFALIDITDTAQLDAIADQKWDTLIHLAALVEVAESIEKEQLYLDTNWRATETLIQKLDYDRFVFVSSAAVHDPGYSPYARSKLNAEQSARRLKPQNSAIVRLYNVVGDSGIKYTNSPGSLFARLAAASERGGFVVNGADYPESPDGSCVRSLIHVNDVAGSLLNLLERPAGDLGIGPFELAYPEPVTVKQFAESFRRSNGLDFEIRIGGRRQGDIPYSRIDTPAPFLASDFAGLEDMTRLRTG